MFSKGDFESVLFPHPSSYLFYFIHMFFLKSKSFKRWARKLLWEKNYKSLLKNRGMDLSHFQHAYTEVVSSYDSAGMNNLSDIFIFSMLSYFLSKFLFFIFLWSCSCTFLFSFILVYLFLFIFIYFYWFLLIFIYFYLFI